MSNPPGTSLPIRFYRIFLDALISEIGADTLSAVLDKASLPANLADPQAVSRYTGQSAAEAYARIQQAMRIYYGRGARGMMVRIGRVLWSRLLESASFPEKAQAQLARTLPPNLRRRAALELLARFMRDKPDAVTVHTLDLDLLLADHASASTVGQSEHSPLCYVTLGLIQEALFWATAREHDVEEVSCRAVGDDACEFKVSLGGK